jgi:hypothetical protein
MSTHASALLLAALAYSFARRYADDQRFSFGTGKVGDLAGFTSAIVLAMIALLIGYEAVSRLIWPVSISFDEAIPIAFLGLAVNVAKGAVSAPRAICHRRRRARECYSAMLTLRPTGLSSAAARSRAKPGAVEQARTAVAETCGVSLNRPVSRRLFLKYFQWLTGHKKP